MKNMRNHLAFLAFAFVLAFACNHHRPAVTTDPQMPSDPRWGRVDSFSQQGLYASALTLTDTILADARSTGDQHLEFRAIMERARFQRLTGVEDTTILSALEDRVLTAPFPLRALLHSVLAEQYWGYYTGNRWTILERTATTTSGGDMATWTQPQFMAKVIAEHRAALAEIDSLKAIPTASLAGLLTDPDMERGLRPTLFDLLAHRALATFRNTETRTAEPPSRFTLNSAQHFALFEDFALKPLGHPDSTSWELQALKLHQALERAHLNSTPPDAYVDNVLARLAFVRERSTLPDKDSLYFRALGTLASRLPVDTCWGDVALAQARWHEEQANKYQRLLEGGPEAVPYKWERKAALDLCDSIIAKHPRSHGGLNATATKARLLDHELATQVEEANVPDAPFKVAVTYRNVRIVWLRIVKDDHRANAPDDDGALADGEALLARKAIKEWSVALPEDGDLNSHATEIAIEGLPIGRYALIASDSSSFKYKSDLITVARFWSTRLGMGHRATKGRNELLVVDRLTGAARAGVRVSAWVRTYRNGNTYARSGEPRTTDNDGALRFADIGQDGTIVWELEDGADRYWSNATWISGYYDGEEQPETRVHLFTDRSIYRPGQPIHFKGIVVRRTGKANTTVEGYSTEVRLLDVNGEKVAALNVKSDAYGSFHGTFTAPQGTLTGSMTLQTDDGAQQVQVEEYKRPTFEVVFDPVAGQPKLGTNATVTGIAKSYAGVPLDGATVQWTVKRSAHMPWWCGWWYRGWLPWGRSTQVAQGTAQCDAQGKFSITFLAEADDQFPRGADPTFNFDVGASATDISGETQSASTSLSLGYRSINLELGLGDQLDRSTADSLRADVMNLNGQRVDVPVDIRIFKLQAPPVPLRERLWERPDRYTMTREEHAMRFPQHAYANEADPLSWTRGAQVFEVRGHVGGGRAMPFRDARTWEVGSYLIEAQARDASGSDVVVRKHFTVFDPGIQNTGFKHDAFHAQLLTPTVEPGAKARLLISSALPDGHVLMEVERDNAIVVKRWFALRNTQQLVELPVQEDDRGGFAIHLLCVERGLVHSETKTINVPWTNKELKTEWMSFRDKLLPGSEEEWRLRITGSKGEKVTAQLLGAMYDASLDHFLPHSWGLDIWGNNYAQLGWGRQEPFSASDGQHVWRERTFPAGHSHGYPELNMFGFEAMSYRFRMYKGMVAMEMMDGDAAGVVQREEVGNVAFAGADATATGSFKGNGAPAPPATPSKPADAEAAQPLRSDFRETAFFFPDLLTDRDGALILRFKTPDALTRWKVMGLTHTKDLRIGHFTREAVTQKPLMIVPNLPRFLRAGDRMLLTAKINVLEAGRAEGLASLELYDPYTNTSLNNAFGLKVGEKSFVAGTGESAAVAWEVEVPEGVDVCGMRITARSKGGPRGGIVASDGEERALPVLTDQLLVTESVALWISAAGTRSFALPNLLAAGKSTTLRHQSLKLEYTPNPAWFAVQALPYLMEFPHECAEQTFSRYYANAVAKHIVDERPAIKQVFAQWKASGADAFASKLEKNQELKQVLLAETPWVLNARDERERKQRVGLLFDLERMGSEEALALKKLRDMQMPNGAWPWWSGMLESRYITQHIVAGFGHLEKLNAADLRPDGQTQAMLKRAVDWLDADVAREYRELLKHTKPEDLAKYTPGAHEIHWLYARSFFPRWRTEGTTATATNFYLERLRATWLNNGLQEQAMAALALHRSGDKSTAEAILRSLKERATVSDELGMVWKNFQAGWSWESFPTETHALMIEAFNDVIKDNVAVNDLRRHLLKLKQTTDWKTTKATADACYALLLTGTDQLSDAGAPVITVGDTRAAAPKGAEAGTGSFEQLWNPSEIRPEMGRVTVTSKADKPSWGALHWQYFERMDKVPAHESPFSLRKDVMLTEPGDSGPRLVALEGTRALKPGDKLTVRIELRTDRYLDFVHMKDLRAAGLEPLETLSGYKYQGGLGYYQSTRDASTDFFFDRIAPGTYVFEYALRVTHAGAFSNGITSAMCMYAPEFSSHSAGTRINVGNR